MGPWVLPESTCVLWCTSQASCSLGEALAKSHRIKLDAKALGIDTQKNP